MEWIEPSDLKSEDWNKESQVVRQVDLPKEMIDLSVKPARRFLSEETQTVKEEMRAANTGLTENRMGDSTNPNPESESSRRTAKKSAQERSEEIVSNSIANEGLGEIAAELKPQQRKTDGWDNVSNELLLPSDPRRNRGVSTTGEALPSDVQVGDFTALNTDRFVFYTYYARTDERIRNPWVRYVRAALYGGGDIPEGVRELVTKLEIVLDREGRYLRTILHEGSGSSDIDRAAMLAFHEAKQIPHPPREMIKEDGTIRLLYAFHVDRLPAVARSKIPARAAGSASSADAKTE